MSTDDAAPIDHKPSVLAATALVIVVAAADVVANILTPEPLRVPVKVLILAVLVVGAKRAFRLSWDELGLGRAELSGGLRLGALSAGVVVAAIAVLVLVPPTRSLFDSADVAADTTTERWLMPLLIIPFGTAVFEEILFRGLLLGVFLRMASSRYAVLASSLLFGLWHLSPALGDARGHGTLGGTALVIGTIIATSLGGAVLALLRLRSGSVAAPILAHTALNSAAYTAALIATSE